MVKSANKPKRCVYVEGAGDGQSVQRSELRQALSRVLGRAGVTRRPRIIPCGGRRKAYERFCHGLVAGQDAYLLVDAEEVVTPPLTEDEQGQFVGDDPWAHVLRRKGDGWARPDGATDAQLHLMTVTMETWLLSDPDALESVFKALDRSKLPSEAIDLEQLSKPEIYDILKQATRATKAGVYGKGPHSFKVLMAVSPERLRTLLWAKRFLNEMRAG